MKTIIVVSGENSTGKSSAIVALHNSSPYTNVNTIFNNNINVVAHGNHIGTGKHLGICSEGDSQQLILKYLLPLIQVNCEVIVCASHGENTQSFKEIERLANQNGYAIIKTSNICNYSRTRYTQQNATRKELHQNLFGSRKLNLNTIFVSTINNLINQVI